MSVDGALSATPDPRCGHAGGTAPLPAGEAVIDNLLRLTRLAAAAIRSIGRLGYG
ncbi:hypothetical protein OHA79_44055 [Streptomyces sp. NBC_00841]|uniref:hypothetical protein n=1 Tax=Streptomyces sp. NBC_00841 TaxID=2975847 RepID=UPI002DD7ECFB|nr:hypothetical protein [Streptomyces sp. NBC_00841]WSA04140.1 hypothetical protein OHA79_44055 [Streptomyces sp. NBC_00841]